MSLGRSNNLLRRGLGPGQRKHLSCLGNRKIGSRSFLTVVGWVLKRVEDWDGLKADLRPGWLSQGGSGPEAGTVGRAEHWRPNCTHLSPQWINQSLTRPYTQNSVHYTWTHGRYNMLRYYKLLRKLYIFICIFMLSLFSSTLHLLLCISSSTLHPTKLSAICFSRN